MSSPIIGAPELVSGQDIPETTVNEQVRRLEQGARWFVFADRDLATPPGSPADGEAYLIAASATGTWTGHDGEIAFRMSTAWEFITPSEGMAGYVLDEFKAIVFTGIEWVEIGGSGGASSQQEWAPNWTADANFYLPADSAMTIEQGNAKIGTGTITFAKSTAAAPNTFTSTTLPTNLEAGAWLRVTATGVSGSCAAHLRRA